MKINKDWFEMQDLRKRKLNTSSWVPLRTEKQVRNSTQSGYADFFEEFTGAGSLMVPMNQEKLKEKLQWMDIGIINNQRSLLRDEIYISSDLYKGENIDGINLVLCQSFDNNTDENEWHLHQDLVIALGLKREGDIWVCPKYGYTDVARLERDSSGKPILLEIRNQFLKDYLYVRNYGLYVARYFSRIYIYQDPSELPWTDEFREEKNGKDIWEYNLNEIHEGGFLYGQKIAISHAARTDIDKNEDIPDISSFPNEDNIEATFYEKSFTDRKLYKSISELWKFDWVEPGKISPIILGDDESDKVNYIVEADGSKQSSKELKKGGKWLWFRPQLVNVLLSKRGSFLTWYSAETGSIGCAPDGGIHFGVNDLGLITVYAKDLAYLPEWQQQIWAGFNISPEGGISKELYASQVKAVAPRTLAPENFLEDVLNNINLISNEKFGINFFRNHQSIKEIISTINRFKAVDDNGIFSLAKDIARVIIDDINTEGLQKITIPPKNTRWGSLKTIENLLALRVPQEEARMITSPFVGIYELRHGDAHLPGSSIFDSFNLIPVDRQLPYVLQGHQILYVCVNNLHVILEILKNWNDL
ncbi:MULTISPECIES: hypothetical protein [unclassified Chryseobacterium]|uniref:hypothetical protein n=1 Tax=unclassified Chryseobacterium TaxID=2593645 RepID=UPI000D3A4CEE|nr:MULTISPECIES: hypothetical protein [unclassified Chryseobacterium]PTT76085.1 hypothetical protein DBR25_06920 [Chryseobacterium sp. HMWF001]PVV60590.1 hypothetical protein DD829_04525 [Chryseobacterium sp. HMWF035]